MIQIVGGLSNALWEAAMQRLKTSYESGRSVLLLVPEQYTLQAERDTLETLQVKGFFRVQVLSPSRLATYVFDRAGQDPRVMIDERGQTMTLARLLWNLKDELVYYAKARGKPGFTQKLTEAISELKSTGITPEELGAWLSAQEVEQPKLRDLATLFSAYEDQMAGQLADAQDKEQEMLRRLQASALFAGHDVIVYGFDLLTPPLIRLLSLLAQRADNLLLTLVMAREEGRASDLFAPVITSATLFTRELEKLSLPWQWDVLAEGKQDKQPALLHLQHQLTRLKQAVFTDPPEGLRLFAGKTPHEEMRRIAQLIHAQLKAGTDPRDIAIFMAQESYAPLLSSVLSDYDIPHFVSVKEPLLAQPLIRCLLDALTCIQSAAWRPLDVFSYLKSPYSPITAEEAFLLENYARENGIRGKRWTLPFTRGEEDILLVMEPLRARAITPIVALRDRLNKARTAEASIDALLAFLTDIKAQERVLEMDITLSEQGMLEEAQRARQVWEQLMGLMEQMNQLLGKERIPLGRFAEWLRAGLSMSMLSALPPMQHCVQAGVLGQLMVREPKAVYILGLNNGALDVGSETLMKDREREQLEEGLDITLNLKRQELENIRMLDLWKAIAAPTQQLHLSYALSDDEGRALSPLIELGRIKRMFTQLVEEGGALHTLRESQPLTPMAALDEVAVLIKNGEMDETWWTAWSWLLNAPDWQHKARGIARMIKGDDPNKALPADAVQNTRQPGVTSVSRLESYAACPFRHFVDYRLMPYVRREWELQPADLGSFYHDAMDRFVRRVKDKPDWLLMDEKASQAEMDQVLGELTQDWADGPWADTSRAKHNARAAISLCRRMAWAITEGRQHSVFAPRESELTFGQGRGYPPIALPMKDGSTLDLRGMIDRLDTAISPDDQLLLRIIDYKSSQHELRGGDLEAGVQLQLMLYLKAALDLMGEDAVPAGAFYQRLGDPLVRADDPARAESQRRRQVYLEGVLLADPDIIRLMDDGTPPVSMSKKLNASGELMKSNKVLNREELQSLMDLAQERSRELAEDILRGVITRAPFIDGAGRAVCEFCEYQGMCRTEKIQTEPLARKSRKVDLKTLAQERLTRSAGKRKAP
ncbi:MAG: PD-(D/E)XK nuclease family protein [Christensenellales bacterium]|jgi:ATP-dependent helicase/nuclease subunit B